MLPLRSKVKAGSGSHETRHGWLMPSFEHDADSGGEISNGARFEQVAVAREAFCIAFEDE